MLVGYNCQALPSTRPITTILDDLHPDSLILQGSSVAPRRDPRTGTLQQRWYESRNGYDIWHWTRNAATSARDLGGLVFAARHRRIRGIKPILYQPTDCKMQGRAALIRFRKSGHFDICFVMLYLPSPRGPDARCLYDGLLTWTEETLAIIGSRCRMVGMTDANARLASVPLQNDHGDVIVGTSDAVHVFRRQTCRQSILTGLEQVVIRGREDYECDIALIC